MPPSTSASASKHSLHRRRGHKSGTSRWGIFQSGIALLGCLALLLTCGMVLLLLFVAPLPNAANNSPGVLDKYSRGMGQKLMAAEHLLRGRVPPAVGTTNTNNNNNVHTERDQMREKMREQILANNRDHAHLRHHEENEQLQQQPKDDDKDDDNKIEEREETLDDVNNAGVIKDDDNRDEEKEEGDSNKSVVGGASNGISTAAIADAIKSGEYPYPLEPVSESLDIRASWTPLGGDRFAEYKDGRSPFTITEALKQTSDKVARSRRAFVKKAMQFAWNGYVKFAFGQDEVMPQSRTGHDNWGGMAITLVDSLDTLWLTGLKDEFWQARDWVRDHLSHANVGHVSVFETTIRDLGGLLSAYDWSGDETFLEHAKDLGRRLLRAFDGSPTGIPFGKVALSGDGENQNLGWAGGNAIIAEVGTLQLEFRYLAKIAKDPSLCQKTDKAFEILKSISPNNGLFPYFVRNNPGGGSTTPSFGNDKLTFGAMGDSLYEYMLKVWIQSGKTDKMYRDMYDLAIDSMHNELLQTSTPSGLVYIADKSQNSGEIDHKMDHLVCFMGGLLALGAYTDPMGLDSPRAQRDLKTGKALTYTCYQMYARMNTGISAEYVQFVNGRDFEVGRGAPHYLLRPEAVESFFILNQLTGDPVYREWGWEVFQSIEKYCKTQIGYGELSDVQDTSGRPRDKMESFFLAETLKYLYLLQDPDTEVDVLNKHVFNTEAHPTRIFPVIDKA